MVTRAWNGVLMMWVTLTFAASAQLCDGQFDAPPLQNRIDQRGEEEYRQQVRKMGGRMLARGFKSSWSPDGKCIVFGLKEDPFPGGAGGLQILEVATGETTTLLESGKDPSWSPVAGGPIAYVDGGYGAQEQIWLIDASGENRRMVTIGGFPSWSPDGRTLFFHTRTDGQMRSVVVQQEDFRSTRRVELATVCWYPVVSPDGKLIASSRRGAPFIVDRETGKEIQSWSCTGFHGLLFGWSADGRRVGAGGYGRRDNTGLWMCDVASGRLKRVLEGPATMPAWSPDGTKICFDLRFPSGPEIWMVDAKAFWELPWRKPDPSPIERADGDLPLSAKPENVPLVLPRDLVGQTQKNKDVREIVEMMKRIARRLLLLGTPIEIAGVQMDGTPLDWESYRGKVVLIHFWATSSETCVAEIPDLKRCYELYHERGFEVVGISMDRDRNALERFLQSERIPWTTLHSHQDNGEHPLATQYEVSVIPSVWLVDREGRVVSL